MNSKINILTKEIEDITK